jgi:FG-GAP-like repeat/ASPIC and UnbV
MNRWITSLLTCILFFYLAGCIHVRTVQDVQTGQPTDIRILKAQAETCFEAHRFKEAAELFQRIRLDNPDDYDILLSLWQAQMEADLPPSSLRQEIDTQIRALILTGEPDAVANAYLGAAYIIEDELLAGEIKNILVRDHPHHDTSEAIVKNELDMVGLEKDPDKRLEMIADFQSMYPQSRHLASSVDYELQIYRHLEDMDALKNRALYWCDTIPDDYRIHKSAAEQLYAAGIALDESLHASGRALELLESDTQSLQDADIPEKQHHHDLAACRLIRIRILLEFNRLEEALDLCSGTHRYIHDNNTGLQAALAFVEGAVAEQTGDVENAVLKYLECVIKGAPRNRWVPDACARFDVLSDEPDASRRMIMYRNLTGYHGPVFDDVTRMMGLTEIKGGRIAWGDADGDGYDDLLVNGVQLLLNKKGSGFENVSESSGLPPEGAGGIWADVNNDGHLDVFVLSHSAEKTTGDAIFLGDGTSVFTRNTAYHVADQYPTEGAAWADFDGDGWIDLYVANYEKQVTENQQERGLGTPDFLYRNLEGSVFADVTLDMGVIPPFEENLCGRGVNWADYDNDGDADLFVSNYRLQENFLYRNDGDRFENVALTAGVAGTRTDDYWGHTIGSVWGDYDNDGDLDLFSANLAHPRYIEFSDISQLLVNNGYPDFDFTDRIDTSGITYDETHSDPAWGDVDNDGDLDLYLTSIYKNERSYLYLNNGDGSFSDITCLSGTRVLNGWGCAFSDFDRDGDLDLAVGSSSGVTLFRNQGGGNHWIQVGVQGSTDNVSAIGTRVTVIRDQDLQIREIEGGKGTSSQQSLIQHFGLGTHASPVQIRLQFPSGDHMIIGPFPVDNRVTIKQ